MDKNKNLYIFIVEIDNLIVVAYGTESELPNPIPSTYAFPSDL